MNVESAPGSGEDLEAIRAELASLTTEASNPELAPLDMMSTAELVDAMNAQDQLVAPAVARLAPAIVAAVDAIHARLAAGGRLFYTGAGTAGRLGILDASEIPPTFGAPASLVVGLIAGGPTAIGAAVENAEDDAAAGAAALAGHGLGPQDAVVGISASGRTPYVLGALAHARELGALTVGLSCNTGSPIGAAAQIPIEVEVGPEFVTGSTRLKSGTAQKLVLNMLSTLTMVKLGKTYGSMMVDLKATNAKLRARSQRTVMQATGCSPEEASRALDAAQGSVKLAILLLLSGVEAAQGQAALDAAQGHLRAALNRLSS